MLTKADLDSSTWARLRAWAEQRIEQHRGELESMQCSEAQTQRLRARISECRELIGLASKPKTIARHGDRTSLVAQAHEDAIATEAGVD